jgi:Trk K+ transport system NAD-binding subunit
VTTGSISAKSIRHRLDHLQPSESVRRRQQVLIPHGDTALKPGDVLVAVVKGDARKTVQQICGAGAEKSA